MRDVQPNDVNHQSVPSQGELLAASAIAQFYTFADRCMDWAKTTRSFQERALYVQMGLQWLAAGASLQTFLQLQNRHNTPTASFSSERQARLQEITA